jgi:hypothetical protein
VHACGDASRREPAICGGALEPSPSEQLKDHDDDHDDDQDVYRVPRQYRNRDGSERAEQPQDHEDHDYGPEHEPSFAGLTGVSIVAAGGQGWFICFHPDHVADANNGQFG